MMGRLMLIDPVVYFATQLKLSVTGFVQFGGATVQAADAA